MPGNGIAVSSLHLSLPASPFPFRLPIDQNMLKFSTFDGYGVKIELIILKEALLWNGMQC